MTVRALTLILALVFSIGSAPADVQWRTFRDPTGAFTAEFPGTPTVQNSQSSGDIAVVHYLVDLGQIAVLVADADFTASPRDPQAAIEGGVASVKAGKKLLSEAADKLDGVSGRALKLEKDGTVLSARVFYVNDHLYQAITVALKTKPTAEQAAIIDRFLRSFHFTKK